MCYSRKLKGVCGGDNSLSHALLPEVPGFQEKCLFSLKPICHYVIQKKNFSVLLVNKKRDFFLALEREMDHNEM